MSEWTIVTNDLVKEFKAGNRAVRAVDGLSLRVARGETYGLIGPDGAGKSTTIKMLSGICSQKSFCHLAAR